MITRSLKWWIKIFIIEAIAKIAVNKNINEEMILWQREKIFMNAKEVQDFLEVSRTTAYQIINEMNQELVELGYRVQRGKINRQYFLDKYCYQVRKEA